ncbi:TetR/AcrR family transcriptional regulator [Falsirhodobacter sp. 1013]|uniref:TetR/AcrR family transcriptional regulator n=1 Tax=Falsirhodobacter sp. 1013 TaxID=3417566 RepID=UPI003EBD1424
MNQIGTDETPRPIVRRKRGEERLRLLIDATDALVSEQDLETVTLQQIAQRAGIPVSSIYHFFPNREAAFIAVAKQHLKWFDKTMGSRLVAPPESWQDFVRIRLHSSADYLNQHRSALRLLLGRHISDEMQQVNAASYLRLARARLGVLDSYFVLPSIEGLDQRFANGGLMADAVHGHSFTRHGYITEYFLDESTRAVVSYLRCYLPEYLPRRA